jgi:hypothetical protein
VALQCRSGLTEVKSVRINKQIEEDLDPDPGSSGVDRKQLFAEVGAGALIAAGVFIGKLLFDRGAPAAPQPIVINNPNRGHSRMGYRHRKRKK